MAETFAFKLSTKSYSRLWLGIKYNLTRDISTDFTFIAQEN